MPVFKITYLPEIGRLWVESQGFWDVATACAFHRELEALFETILREKRAIRLLSEARDFATQSAEVAQVFKESAVLMRAIEVERWAVVQPNALQRMQFRRTASNHTAHVFETVEEAMAWIEWPADRRPSSITDRAAGALAHG